MAKALKLKPSSEAASSTSLFKELRKRKVTRTNFLMSLGHQALVFLINSTRLSDIEIWAAVPRQSNRVLYRDM